MSLNDESLTRVTTPEGPQEMGINLWVNVFAFDILGIGANKASPITRCPLQTLSLLHASLRFNLSLALCSFLLHFQYRNSKCHHWNTHHQYRPIIAIAGIAPCVSMWREFGHNVYHATACDHRLVLSILFSLSLKSDQNND